MLLGAVATVCAEANLHRSRSCIERMCAMVVTISLPFVGNHIRRVFELFRTETNGICTMTFHTGLPGFHLGRFVSAAHATFTSM